MVALPWQKSTRGEEGEDGKRKGLEANLHRWHGSRPTYLMLSGG